MKDAYITGMIEAFEGAGANHEKAVKVASVLSEFRKTAYGFGVPWQAQEEDDQPFDWKSVVIPILAAGLAGFVGYQARDKGFPDRSMFSNIKNYVMGGARNLIRQGPRPIYDYKNLLNQGKPQTP